MMSSEQSSILGTVDADEESLSITCLRKQELKGKRLSAKETHDHKTREKHKGHSEPDGEHNVYSYDGKERQYPFECAVIVLRSH